MLLPRGLAHSVGSRPPLRMVRVCDAFEGGDECDFMVWIKVAAQVLPCDQGVQRVHFQADLSTIWMFRFCFFSHRNTFWKQQSINTGNTLFSFGHFGPGVPQTWSCPAGRWGTTHYIVPETCSEHFGGGRPRTHVDTPQWRSYQRKQTGPISICRWLWRCSVGSCWMSTIGSWRLSWV